MGIDRHAQELRNVVSHGFNFLKNLLATFIISEQNGILLINL